MSHALYRLFGASSRYMQWPTVIVNDIHLHGIRLAVSYDFDQCLIIAFNFLCNV